MLIARANFNGKHIKGVTLIELLVVITIMMTMLALVAPLTIKAVDKAEAQSEYISFCNLLRRISVEAFTTNSDISITLDGSSVTVVAGQNRAKTTSPLIQTNSRVLVERSYKHLKFANVGLVVNKNGMPNIKSLNLFQQDRQRQLILASLFE